MTEPAVVVEATKRSDPSRWVRLGLTLRRDPDDGLGGLAHAATLLCAVEGVDALARTYALENWESGVLSGYFFVCRRARRMPPPPLQLFELSGVLGSDDMGGVVAAAEAAVAQLLGQPAAALRSDEWAVAVAPRMPVGQAAPA